MNSTELIAHTSVGFDSSRYILEQSSAISQRVKHFPAGRLYLEIGGKFLYDPHAQRVLPGFEARIKPVIIEQVGIPFSVIFCVNAQDIKENRMLSSKNTPYLEYTTAMIKELLHTIKGRLDLSITLVSEENQEFAKHFSELMHSTLGLQSYFRYAIPGYPHTEKVLTPEGYGRDDYISQDEPLVLVTGAASNSGKMGTCLSQLYLDSQHGVESGYAKYELFPIWNLPVDHPVNLAYEAATVDISDYNLVDPFHLSAHNVSATNYNRDVDAFPIVQHIASSIVRSSNYMNTYQSPTDMGLNTAGYAITNDLLVQDAAIAEIQRRTEWFATQIAEGRGEQSWLGKLEKIAQRAKLYRSQTEGGILNT